MDNIRFIEDVKAKGNFWFLHNINREVYKELSSAEKIVRTNFKQCGNATRQVLETMVSCIIRDFNLQNRIPGNMDLFEKIKSLRDVSFLRKVKYLAPDQQLEDKPIIPSIGIVKVTYENGDSS